MPRRKPRADKWAEGGTILDAPPSVDAESWAQASILDSVKAARPEAVCHCPPPSKGRFGGCMPALRRSEGTDALEPYCVTCQRPLVPGVHRRRDQTRVIALAKLPPEHLDLEDLAECGLLRDDNANG